MKILHLLTGGKEREQEIRDIASQMLSIQSPFPSENGFILKNLIFLPSTPEKKEFLDQAEKLLLTRPEATHSFSIYHFLTGQQAKGLKFWTRYWVQGSFTFPLEAIPLLKILLPPQKRSSLLKEFEGIARTYLTEKPLQQRRLALFHSRLKA